MIRFFKYCFVFFFFCSLLMVAAGTAGLYYLVVMVPTPEIEEAHINEILGRESPVFYRDGQTKLGVLFEGIHRQYLPYKDIPQDFVNALIAAEDNQYFHHFGIDPPGIIRAMIANLQAGRIVQGGSTITQQTAKNLFKRESRSMEAKIKELLFALRLEHRYSKEKILEFYCNQFFVSGNGHGLGVAARYFFDKEPKELTLLECAFIAGSVKRPNYYNPFLRKNQANAEEVRQRGEERVNYVLEQMRKVGMLGERDYKQLNVSNLVFRQGKMSFAQNTAMDLVKEGLETAFIADTLEENGISNISTSGARIITSLDQSIQAKTVQALRRQLSQLDVRLRGYSRAQVQSEYQSLDYSGDEDFVPGNCVFGTVEEITDTRERGPVVRVVFDEGRAVGTIDSSGLVRLADAHAKFARNAAASGPADRKAVLRQVQAGDKVYTCIREVDDGGMLLLDLEKYPKVEGAAFVLQEGAIRAMSGGMSNLNYNRATTAKRLMGSTFKTFVLAAALQLGWSPIDMISNTPQTFMFMNRPYAPQPDHDSPFGSVSLSWAGVTSENVAAVWLLYHLTDHLTPAMVRELATQVDMAPRVVDGTTEDYQQYKARMRDKYGIVVSREYLGRAVFSSAVRALKPDFVFENRTGEYGRLERMRYDEFLGLRALLPRLAEFRRSPLQSPPTVDPDSAFDNPGESVPPTAGRLVKDTLGRFIFTRRSELPPNWMELSAREIADHLFSLDPTRYESFWQEEVQLEGVLSAADVQQLDEQIRIERDKVDSDKLYSMEVLSEVRDFRVMLGLQYMVRLAKECGINSNFEPVLSLPLGSNVVSLSEMTRLYETLLTGYRHDAADASTLALAELDGRVDPDGAAIIERIETPEGRVVYSRQVHKTRVIDAKSSAAIGNILQNVIPYGTGKYAKEHVRLRSTDPERQKIVDGIKQTYPLLGKTGTANDYRNAAFLGFVPVLLPDQSGVGFEGGYTVGVYTGYDDNMPMVRGRFRVSGSQGALPAWSDIAQGLLDVERIADRIDPVDLTFDGLSLRYPDVGQIFVPVAPNQGGAAASSSGARQVVPPAGPASLCFGARTEGGRFEPLRQFLPFWKNR
ncbi:Peptidoglycan glycosyltransferase [Desulfobulbus propionicus DSM 2032]|uniref:Peptidoglycan glycosyltransferase n=1 Tax=Desulfobulbus propionicus (strain ATCC 33891 / DSM 2032 / VKM B-1956 / 1pr3) TaxID=577650 RepID=A0A7U3YKG9_DESPD|nr:transglycosylase domain-containing protein [Desulfobulbus propionicus]ADW17057.1 Peptidoglycan glycosyltransferase [Desulfobulbus propionicus DSM 2032]